MLSELGDQLLSSDQNVWMPAGIKLGDVLEEDILLNLAGIAQCIAIKFPKGIPHFLRYVLRPSREALDTLPISFLSPTAQQDEIKRALDDIAGSASTVVALCDTFYERLGHLPLSPDYGLPALIAEWKRLHPDICTGEVLLRWAFEHRSYYARFHACLVFLTHPNEAAPSQWKDIAKLIVETVGSFEPDPSDARISVPWELRCDLAKHYLQYLEPLVPGQDERGAGLAWWLADRFACCLGGDEQFLSSVRTGTIQPEEARSGQLWLLCRPPAQASALRYSTLYLHSPWGYALLSALTAESAAALSAADDEHFLNRLGGAYVHCLLYTGYSFPTPQSWIVGGNAPTLCNAAATISRANPNVQAIATLNEIAELGNHLIEPKHIFESIRDYQVRTPQDQFLSFNALRTLVHSDASAEDALWDVLQNGDWRNGFLSNAPLAVLELLSNSIAYLAGIHDRWRSLGPHMFAIGAMNALKDPDRRQALFALTVLVSLAAGATSSIHRMLQSKKRGSFRDDVTYWRERISSSLPSATPWAQGRLRSMLSALHMA